MVDPVGALEPAEAPVPLVEPLETPLAILPVEPLEAPVGVAPVVLAPLAPTLPDLAPASLERELQPADTTTTSAAKRPGTPAKRVGCAIRSVCSPASGGRWSSRQSAATLR